MPVVVAPLVIAIGALLAALLIWTLRRGVQSLQFGVFMQRTQHHGGVLNILATPIRFVIGAFSTPIRKVLHYLDSALATSFFNRMQPAIAWVAHLGAVIEGFAFSSYYTAIHTYQALRNLRHAVIPRLIERSIAVPVRVGTHAGHIGRAALRDAAALAVRAFRLARTAEATAQDALATAEQALQHAVTVPLPRTLPVVEHWVGYTRKQLARLLRRAWTHPERLAIATMGAVAVYALGRIGAGWLKCSNWQRIGRAGCRMPARWLDDVLGLVADFVIVSNVCTVLPWIESAASTVGVPIVEVLTPIGAGLCRGSSGPPPPLGVPLTDAMLPATASLSTL